jgi:hypothetical protein
MQMYSSVAVIGPPRCICYCLSEVARVCFLAPVNSSVPNGCLILQGGDVALPEQKDYVNSRPDHGGCGSLKMFGDDADNVFHVCTFVPSR